MFFEWLHNGVSILSGSGDNLPLSIPSVDLRHQGAYSCRATLGDNSVIGPAPAGQLSVFGKKLTIVVHCSSPAVVLVSL